jgi:hypothetical protein
MRTRAETDIPVYSYGPITFLDKFGNNRCHGSWLCFALLPTVGFVSDSFSTFFSFVRFSLSLNFLFIIHYIVCVALRRPPKFKFHPATNLSSATMIITRALSITNFIVASSALSFQVGVLYPWHKQLDDDFEALKREHLRVLTAVEGKVGRTQEPALLEEHRPSILSMIGNLAPWKA